MRLALRLSLMAAILAGPALGIAQAVTPPQLVELMKAGLDDDNLIALIQTDGSTFQLTASDLISLRKQGLSNRVILAMQQTARKAVSSTTNRDSSISQEQNVDAAAPAVTVYQTVTQRVEPGYGQPYPVLAVPIPVAVRPAATHAVAAPPVYWGWNGQRRPDAWKESPDSKTPAPTDKDKKKGQ